MARSKKNFRKTLGNCQKLQSAKNAVSIIREIPQPQINDESVCAIFLSWKFALPRINRRALSFPFLCLLTLLKSAWGGMLAC